MPGSKSLRHLLLDVLMQCNNNLNGINAICYTSYSVLVWSLEPHEAG